MKAIIQRLLGKLGLRLIRLDRDPLSIFFSVLKSQGFAPKHIIDVGANHGLWTREALKYFPDAHYTLVEPQDWLKTHVQDLIARNHKFSWVGAGVADSTGLLPFTIAHEDVSSSFGHFDI